MKHASPSRVPDARTWRVGVPKQAADARMCALGCHYNALVQVHASAPTRIDLAGGTLDIWPLYLFHDGAQTLNAAISLRAHCSIGHWAIVERDDRAQGFPVQRAHRRSSR